jgi:hypothetical protein
MPSPLKTLREALSSHMELSEYFLGMHALFDGDVVFARDVVQVNIDLSPCPVDFQTVWTWFRQQLRGQPEQETFAYQLVFTVGADDDHAMEKLLDMTRGLAITVWMTDLANQETPTDCRRLVVITVPNRKGARAFRDEFHGKDLALA